MEKLLVVDDIKIVRDAMVIFLKQAFGCEVDTACDGAEALAKWKTSNYSLLLMDYEMPAMSGFECVGKIRNLESLTGMHTPIICITASQERDIEERCIAAGMDGYLSKECSNQELEDAVRKWVVPITMHPVPIELKCDPIDMRSLAYNTTHDNLS